MKMKDGVFIIEATLPQRMPYEKAMHYYAEKLDHPLEFIIRSPKSNSYKY